MIKELIAQGCDVNAVCRDGSNALSAYVGAPDCYSADGCEALLQAGCNALVVTKKTK
jgi:hypothetical protein